MGEVALVILGCVVRVARVASDSGLAEGALRRRVVAGARAWDEGRGRVVIVSGGRAWGGHVEADAMARGLEGLGVPGAAIVRERASFTTRENARYVAAVCGRRGIGEVALVTCGWHLPRAAELFEREGLGVVERISAGNGDAGWAGRAWIWAKERALRAHAAVT